MVVLREGETIVTDRYECIRKFREMEPHPDLSLSIKFRITEDLTQIGGEKTVLREFVRHFGEGADPNEVADQYEALAKEMADRADAIAAKYGFEAIVKEVFKEG